MTTDTLSPLASASPALGALSSQQLKTLVGQVREQSPLPSFDSDESLKDSLVGRAEPMAQGVVSALGLASIALLSEARAEQALANLSPLRLALDSLDATFLSTEPQLMALLGPNAGGELGALRADVAALDWSELVSMVHDLSTSLSNEVLPSSSDFTDGVSAPLPIGEGLSAILADLPLLEQAGQALPGLEATLTDAGVSVPDLLASGALPVVALPAALDPLTLVSGVGDTVLGVVDATVDGVLGTVDNLLDGALGTVGGVVGGVTDLVEGLLGGDGGPLGNLTETVQDVVEVVDNTLGGALDAVSDLANGLTDTLEGVLGGVTDSAGSLLDLVVGGSDGLLGGLTQILNPDGSDGSDTGLIQGLDDGDLVGLVSELLGEETSALVDGVPLVDDLLTGTSTGDALAPVTDLLVDTTDGVTDALDAVAGSEGLLGGLTDPLVSSNTEDGSLLGNLTQNLLG
ncbi:hypothetical protein [Aquabacterium sp. A08]|uniref:hypothetical protein n=1 Tax=Aquabacterium sp. A08 TaxID=2718532 RepID=UPI00142307B5|nr:hypothetical protein [Aquabacterium sp. A08]NIC40972.1 hypothetical protein [Aquabacterium sp. A08]